MSEDTLTHLRAQGESLFSSLQKEYYSSLSGRSKKSGIEGIFNSHREFGESELFLALNETVCGDEAGGGGLSLLRAFLADMHILSRTASLTDEVLSLEASSVLKIGKKKIPFRSAFQKILGEPKKKKRDGIESSRLETQGNITPHLKEIIYETEGASESLGYSNFKELKAHIELGDTSALIEKARLFIHDTEYVSKEMLKWFYTRYMELPLKDSTVADLSFMLNSFELKGGFPDNEYFVPAARVLDDSGLVNSSDVSVDSEKRKRKAPGSMLFLTSPPSEMAVSIFPAGGPEDYEAYLHALGSALSYAFTDRDDNFEYRCLRDPVQTDIFAELFKNLIFERKWLDRYIHYERGDDFYKLLFLRRLMSVRKEAGRLIYEASLYSGESVDNLQEIYKEIMEEALLTQVDVRDFLKSVDLRRPMRSLSRFKSILIEPALSKYLKESFDEEWWRVRDAGDFLRDIWRKGGRCGSEEISELCGFDGTFASLRRVFERELS